MRNALRAVWVVFMLGVLIVLVRERGAAQARANVPMPPNLFTVKQLTSNLYVIMPSGPDTSNVGGNVGVLVTDEGVLVVDTNYNRQRRNGQSVPMGQSVVDQIKKITTQPIKYVINTHHHGDHTGGNPIFAKFATIYAQRNVRNRLVSGYENALKNAPDALARARQSLVEAQATRDAQKIADAQEAVAQAEMNLQDAQSFDPRKAGPHVTYDGELAFFLGGEEIHVFHPARAHTDGDSIIYFKNANVAHWGDGFANNWVPVIDAGSGGSSLEWLQFIDKGIQMVGENATMVPGHGAIAKAADIRRLRSYFTNMHTRVRAEIAAGKTREQAIDDVTVPDYANLPGGAARIRQNVAAVYDELKARPQ
jgi:glyoxylase-like metal-dependent hydrolase (beta-lactamase superfamily II)